MRRLKAPLRGALAATLRLLCTASPLALSSEALAQAVNPPNAKATVEGKVANIAEVDHAQLRTAPPPGFGQLDQPVHTLFDVIFSGHTVGSFNATLDGDKITFDQPAQVAAALGGDLNTAAVTAFLSRPLDTNGKYRCGAGQSADSGCGLLPKSMSGVIVNSDKFEITLILGREFFLVRNAAPQMLGAPQSGLSLVQGIRFSLSSDGRSQASYGGIFDTTISDGRTALIAENTLSQESGLQSEELYAQRIWSDRRLAAGILQDFQSLTFDNYRMLGAEFGSFYDTYLDKTNDTATPVQVVLPRRAQIEIYRDNVLIYTGQYEAGLQLIDTHSFPSGSYSIHIIARDGPTVLLDERRSFSKVSNLPPPGKTGFLFRIGERLQDSFETDGNTQVHPFFPSTTGELVASASAQRRLGKDFAASLSVTSFNTRVFSEASMQFFLGKFTGLVGAGAGSNGAVSAIVSASLQLNWVSFTLSGRTTHANETLDSVPSDSRRYEPFAETEDTVFASVQTKLLGGSFSLSGSYTHTPGITDQYAAEAQYTRQIKLPFAGISLLSVFATASEIDRQVGLTISFFKQVTPKTDLSFTAGSTYVSDPDDSERRGLVPTGEAVLTHEQTYGPVDLSSQIGGSSDIDGDRVFAQARGQSAYGTFDGTAERLYPVGSAATNSLLLNGQTGFTIGGGAAKIGISNPGDAVVFVDMRNDKPKPAHDPSFAGPTLDAPADDAPATPPAIAQGGYRITVNTHDSGFIKPGHLVAVGLPAFKQYNIGLKPEGAPQFNLTDTEHDNIALYPGNVVRLKYRSQQVVTLFGRMLDSAGKPLGFTRISADDDFIVTDELGYFIITTPAKATLSLKTRDGAACLPQPVAPLIHGRKPAAFYRVGSLVCQLPAATVPPAR